MDIDKIKALHREHFERVISTFEKGRETVLSIPTGKRLFICNKYRETFNMGGGYIRTTPTLYSVFLLNVTYNGELTYIKEEKNIPFQNTISCYDKNKINLTWRAYRNSLNIKELKEYNKNIEPIISNNDAIEMKRVLDKIEEEINMEIINELLNKDNNETR